jgi:hypothetical protein
VTEILLGVFLGLACAARGTWLAWRGVPSASAWLATGSGLVLVLGGRLPADVRVTGGLLIVGGTGVLTAAVVLIREQVGKRDRRRSLEMADELDLLHMLREADGSRGGVHGTGAPDETARHSDDGEMEGPT